MAELARSIVAAAKRAPSEDALTIMRLSLVDWIAVGLAAADEPVAKITRAMMLTEGGQPQATLFGGQKVPARAAALANGACSHALDYDDTHFAHIGHPSVAVIPAALAMAEMKGASKDQMLRAALAGCEASIRFGLAFGRGHYQAGFHQTATAGAFGATVAAVLLSTPDRAVLAQALGLVSTRASGLKNQFGTMGKAYNAGMAAANGVEAALLAGRGMISNPTALEGAGGFLAAHHVQGEVAQPGGFLMESVSHKFHACCHGLHAALEALELLKPVDPSLVTKVEIMTHPRWMAVCNKAAPQTGLEAKFSYAAVTAFSLLDFSTAALETFSDDMCQRPKVVALRDMVRVLARDDLTETQAHVTVHTTAGPRHQAFDLAGPIDMNARADRVRQKATALLGAEDADAIWQAVYERDGPVGDIARCLA